jgi:hypothetical protein
MSDDCRYPPWWSVPYRIRPEMLAEAEPLRRVCLDALATVRKPAAWAGLKQHAPELAALLAEPGFRAFADELREAFRARLWVERRQILGEETING